MLYSLRTIFASACLMAAALVLSSQQASAGLNPNPVFGSNAASATGWLAGGHAGYNWQQGATVFGFETDIQGTHLNSSMNGGLNVRPPPPPGSFAMTTASIDYYATFRGRFGFTTGQWLFFGTGGAAYGNVNLSSQFGTLGVMTASDISQPKFGGVVGAGFEYMLRPNLTFNFNYQYVDLGRVGIASSTVSQSNLVTLTLAQTAMVHAQFQTLTVGMSWRFAPDGSPSPWAGGYAGGQAGVAWGNSASAVYNSTSIFNGNGL